jgi:enamine deaminase RidA (YjgF/YER057c/UK114 family)
MNHGRPSSLRYTPLALFALVGSAALTQETDPVGEFLSDSGSERAAYSRAVATTGGKTVWIAGQTGLTDESLVGDFEGQTHEVFRLIEERLTHYGGTLSDIVTMTVYINDVRNGPKFLAIRREMFEPGRYPSSALITVVGFARAGILLEVKAMAVIGDEA